MTEGLTKKARKLAGKMVLGRFIVYLGTMRRIDKKILILLFTGFIAIIVLHFSFPNWTRKATISTGIEKYEYHTNFDSEIIGNWSSASNQLNPKGYIVVVQNKPYSSTLILEIDDLDVEGRKFKISSFGYSKSKNDSLFAVLSLENHDKKFYYRAFPMNIMNGKWFNYRFEDELPENIPEGSILKYYVWNSSKTPFMIDQLKMEIT